MAAAHSFHNVRDSKGRFAPKDPNAPKKPRRKNNKVKLLQPHKQP